MLLPRTWRLIPARVLFTCALLLSLIEWSRDLPSRISPANPVNVLAASTTSWQVPAVYLALHATANATLIIDYPEDGSIFPPEITPPTFIWRDAQASANTWSIDIAFFDGSKPFHALSHGERLQLGEIDPRCISSTNQLPSLTPEQAAAHTWKPSAEA